MRGPRGNEALQTVLDVRSFGAAGDGEADDTEAIAKAIESAGKPERAGAKRTRPTAVLLRAGTYRITRTIGLHPRLRLACLRGEGYLLPNGTSGAHTTLVWDGPEGGHMFDVKGYAGLRITDLKFDGGGKAGVLLRLNSVPGVGTAQFFMERVLLDHADTGIELGGDMDMCASDMTFMDVLMDNMKSCGFRAVNFQQVNFMFLRCQVSHAPVGFSLRRGGSSHFLLPSFFAVDTCIELGGGVNNGSYSITGLFLERGSLADMKKRMVVLRADGEVNVSVSGIQTGCQNVWGDDADLETPSFILGPTAQVTVRDSIVSGKAARLAGGTGLPTWIQFDNCRFTRASDPRKDIECDEHSGFELRNCNITVDDTLGKQYRVLRNEMVSHYARYPKQKVSGGGSRR